jgi:Arc/MetJ-type ribon-helix-helix transcriptional regulator
LPTSVTLPAELLAEIENFIEANKHLGYTTREELIRDAVRFKLNALKQKYEYIESSKEDYDKLQQAVKNMHNLAFESADDFIEQQIRMMNGLNKTRPTVRKCLWNKIYVCLLCSFGFTMMEMISAVTVNSMNKPPNIARGILKMGSPWRTWFEGSASA